MISEATFRGRQRSIVNFTVDTQILYGYRWIVASAGVASLSLIVGDARNYRRGCPVLAIYNNGTRTFTIKDNAGGTLQVLTINNCAFLDLLDNSTQAGTWVVNVRAKL